MTNKVRSWLTLAGLCAAGLTVGLQGDDSVHGTPFQTGKAFFERPGTNSSQYPLLPGVNDVSATPNLGKPYRLRSFLSGMLWGTGELSEYNMWVDAPSDPTRWNEGHWQQQRLDQQTVYLNPVMVNYNWPPGQFGDDPNRLDPRTPLNQGGIYNGFSVTNFAYPPDFYTDGGTVPNRSVPGYSFYQRRGFNLAMPFPYLVPDRNWASNFQSAWRRSSLKLETRPLETFLLVPSNLTPEELRAQQTVENAIVTSAWTTSWAPGRDPKAILVDRMGDWDADLIYQDPSAPYARTAFGDAGIGRYLKLTVANGSPFLWCEMNDMRYGQIFNLIEGIRPSHVITQPSAVPGLPEVQYALISGNQDDPQRGYPGVEAVPSQLNPAGAQNNYVTAAVYWYRVNPRASGRAVSFGSGTSPMGPDYLQLDFGQNPGKVFFTVAMLPVQAQYPAAGGTNDLVAARMYAEALGKFAFNFVTGTRLSYAVSKKSVATSTWTSSLQNPYGVASLVDSTNTVQALLPHQYQSMPLGTNSATGQSTSWTPLVPSSAVAFEPLVAGGSTPLRYWSARGGHHTILGQPGVSGAVATSSFQTKYLHNNFLAAMPPPKWTNVIRSEQPLNPVVVAQPAGDLVSTVPIGNSPKQVTVGQFLMDDLATQYMNNTAYGNAPWGVFFHRNPIDSYGINAAFSRVAQQLGTLQLFDQFDAQAHPTYIDEFWYNAQGPAPFYRAPNPNRPGVHPALALEESVAGIQYGIASLFAEQPRAVAVNYQFWSGGLKQDGSADMVTSFKPSLWNLEYFVRWEKEAGRVLMQPNGAFPAFFWTPRYTNMAPPVATTYPPPALQPQRTTPPVPADAINLDPPQSIPTDQSSNPYYPGTMWDGFGISTQFNDHHYNLGYLVAAASLTTIYDNAWMDQPVASDWAKGTQYGAGIDAIVQTLANDPDNEAFQASLFTADEMRVSFPKFSFFDVWAGHPWASGITPGPGLQVLGLNENSNYEGNQAWSGTTLWGMATDRPAVTDLGIFLYTLGSWSGDFYMFDKNGNQVPGNPWSWVPVTTGADTNNGGIYVPGITQHAANPLGGTTQTPVGTATLYQGGGSLANFFGGFPQGSRLIQAFPAAPWHLAMGRNTAFMRNWSAALASQDWQALNVVTPGPDGAGFSNFKAQYMAALDQVMALGGTDRPSAAAPFADPTGKLPLLEYWANLYVGDQSPPYAIGAAGQALLQPSQTVGSMYHWLLTLDQYGLPDFTVVGHATTDTVRAPGTSEDSHVFSAAFTKWVDGKPVTSFFAFNPGTVPVVVNFWRVDDSNEQTPLLGGGLLVPPKRWARAQNPPVAVTLAVVRHPALHQRFLFKVNEDVVRVLRAEYSTDFEHWQSVNVSLHDADTRTYAVELPNPGNTTGFFRVTEIEQ